jgi:hypothetical protein
MQRLGNKLFVSSHLSLGFYFYMVAVPELIFCGLCWFKLSNKIY